MKILKLQWRNIFSYGNNVQTLDFSSEGQLWQLTGVSGSGKSSLMNIPKLLFYGKAEGSDDKPISVNEVANWTNGKGWIRGEVANGENLFVIERTFSPQSVRLFRNGSEIDVAGAKNVQNIIEMEVLNGLPYHIFSNLMTLSLNSGKTFIAMTPSDKRDTIDRIFSLEIINKVYEYIKTDRKELGNNINLLNGQIFALGNTVKASETKLAELTSAANENAKADMDAIRAKIDKLKPITDDQQKQYSEYTAKMQEMLKIESEIGKTHQLKAYELGELNRQLDLYNQDKCPTCGTLFEGEAFEHIRTELKDRISDKKAEIAAADSSIEELKLKKSEISSYLGTLYNNISKLNAKSNELLISLKTIENSVSNTSEFSAIRQIIEDTERQKEGISRKLKEASEKMRLLTAMDSLYSSDGIKQVIMKRYMPMLNRDIADTLEELRFPYSLEFDANFDPCIKYVGRNVKPQNLSTGEHKKIDVTVLCALLKFMKRRYPQMNIVNLDETVSSLDYESSSNVIRHLKELAKEMNIHIFIVSHTQLNESLFDKRINITKNMGFSEISYT